MIENMHEDNDITLYKSLIYKLNQASEAYYTTGHTIMTDAQWDLGLEKLKQLEEKTGYILTNSPTQKVGYQNVDIINKIQHIVPMLSLNKLHSIEEVKDFIKDELCLCSLKLDGLTIRLTYQDGVLNRIETRGNGLVGSDVTFHKNSFINLPLYINKSGTYIIDGECIIKTDDFQTINDNSEQKFENPRNLASGTLNSQSSKISSQRYLRFIAWNVIKGQKLSNSFSQNLIEASSLGFDIVPFIMINSHTDIQSTLDNMKIVASQFCYPIDGTVIAIDNRLKGDLLGRTEHHFNHSVAYKFEDKTYKTKLIDIEWSMGTDKLTPVAIFNPVKIDGSTVERASLHNISYLKKLKLGIGDTITIYKANAIIPQVKENLTKSDTYNIPTICPICGSNTMIINDGICEELICSNESCQGKLLGRCVRFVSKDCMDIDGLSVATLHKFIELKYISTPIDVYNKLFKFKSQISNLNGFGMASTTKLFTAIEKSKNVTLDRFINALNIPMVGKATAKLIAKQCNYDIQQFINLLNNYYDWSQIETIGDTINKSIKEWYIKNGSILKDFMEILHFDNNLKDNTTMDILNGKSICITGKLYHYNDRDELIQDIEKFGGKICSSVTKKTDYLLTNDTESGSSKNKKAKELSIPIITEDDFLQMINVPIKE